MGVSLSKSESKSSKFKNWWMKRMFVTFTKSEFLYQKITGQGERGSLKVIKRIAVKVRDSLVQWCFWRIFFIDDTVMSIRKKWFAKTRKKPVAKRDSLIGTLICYMKLSHWYERRTKEITSRIAVLFPLFDIKDVSFSESLVLKSLYYILQYSQCGLFFSSISHITSVFVMTVLP